MLAVDMQQRSGRLALTPLIVARLAQEYLGETGVARAALDVGRRYLAEGRWTDARLLLERALYDGDADTRPQAAYYLGEGRWAAGQFREAVEAYVIAAVLADDPTWAQRAMLGAARSYRDAGHPADAAALYRRLEDATAAEPAIAEAARTEHAALRDR
jgi:tetratricopeptide (TPR) repeat protein